MGNENLRMENGQYDSDMAAMMNQNGSRSVTVGGPGGGGYSTTTTSRNVTDGGATFGGGGGGGQTIGISGGGGGGGTYSTTTTSRSIGGGNGYSVGVNEPITGGYTTTTTSRSIGGNTGGVALTNGAEYSLGGIDQSAQNDANRRVTFASNTANYPNGVYYNNNPGGQQVMRVIEETTTTDGGRGVQMNGGQYGIQRSYTEQDSYVDNGLPKSREDTGVSLGQIIKTRAVDDGGGYQVDRILDEHRARKGTAGSYTITETTTTKEKQPWETKVDDWQASNDAALRRRRIEKPNMSPELWSTNYVSNEPQKTEYHIIEESRNSQPTQYMQEEPIVNSYTTMSSTTPRVVRVSSPRTRYKTVVEEDLGLPLDEIMTADGDEYYETKRSSSPRVVVRQQSPRPQQVVEEYVTYEEPQPRVVVERRPESPRRVEYVYEETPPPPTQTMVVTKQPRYIDEYVEYKAPPPTVQPTRFIVRETPKVETHYIEVDETPTPPPAPPVVQHAARMPRVETRYVEYEPAPLPPKPLPIRVRKVSPSRPQVREETEYIEYETLPPRKPLYVPPTIVKYPPIVKRRPKPRVIYEFEDYTPPPPPRKRSPPPPPVPRSPPPQPPPEPRRVIHTTVRPQESPPLIRKPRTQIHYRDIYNVTSDYMAPTTSSKIKALYRTAPTEDPDDIVNRRPRRSHTTITTTTNGVRGARTYDPDLVKPRKTSSLDEGGTKSRVTIYNNGSSSDQTRRSTTTTTSTVNRGSTLLTTTADGMGAPRLKISRPVTVMQDIEETPVRYSNIYKQYQQVD